MPSPPPPPVVLASPPPLSVRQLSPPPPPPPSPSPPPPPSQPPPSPPPPPPAKVPGAPTNAKFYPSCTDVTKGHATWTAPASDGGSYIFGYKVACYYAVPSLVFGPTLFAAGVTCGGTPCTGFDMITGLAMQTSYTCDVVAVNAVGDGPASVASPSAKTYFTVIVGSVGVAAANTVDVYTLSPDGTVTVVDGITGVVSTLAETFSPGASFFYATPSIPGTLFAVYPAAGKIERMVAANNIFAPNRLVAPSLKTWIYNPSALAASFLYIWTLPTSWDFIDPRRPTPRHPPLTEYSTVQLQ